jgi:hypothetical protein
VQLSSSSGVTLLKPVGRVTIFDDDMPSVSVSPAAVTEGGSGTTSVFVTISLSAAYRNAVTVNWSTGGGTATAGVDYLAASGALTFAAGETTKTIAITVNGDLLFEANETFIVTLAAPVNATLGTSSAAVTITNDDAAPPPPSGPVVSLGDASVKEGNSGTTTATLTLTLSQVATVDVVVQLRITGGAATAGSDYQAWTPLTQQVVIRAGQTSATVVIFVVGDKSLEDTETVVVEIVSVTGGTGTGDTGTVTILDDDRKLATFVAAPSGRDGTLEPQPALPTLVAAPSPATRSGTDVVTNVGVTAIDQVRAILEAAGGVLRAEPASPVVPIPLGTLLVLVIAMAVFVRSRPRRLPLAVIAR